jgi:hypothetical protein
MSRSQDRRALMTRLETALEHWGARPERWPQEIRAELVAFAQTDEDAARRMAEERALDRLLALAPGTRPVDGLEARILAAAEALPQVGEAAPGPERRSAGNVVAYAAQPRPSLLRRNWPEATLLAASLFLGLLIGVSGQALPAFQGIRVLVASGGDPGVTLDALFDLERGPGQEAL